MSYLEKISSPTLLIDEKICRNNFRRMSEKASRHHMKLIPHFKTPQSRAIGKWAKDFGIEEITVSSVKMAEYLSGQGWKNIHIAFPFNILETKRLNTLAGKQNVSVQLVNEKVAYHLANNLEHSVGFFIEIDAGYGRTGVQANNRNAIDAILSAAKASDKLHFKGFYIHPGHSYYNDANVEKIYEETRTALHGLKESYRAQYPGLVTRVGDTPGCSKMEDFGDIDEMGPGNFIFYDLVQESLGSCRKEDIAVALAVPVVDINYSKGEILVHGGGVHLSKDVLPEGNEGKNFGEVVLLEENGWTIPAERSYLKSISQEHGIIKASDELLSKVKIGDVLGILPIHSCMTADCMKGYLSISGEKLDHAEGG